MSNNKVIGVIPARYASTRFPAKVLAMIAGKPMIQHVWERAKESKELSDIVIACDDERVLHAAKSFGAKAVLTSVNHTSGTDRIAEAVHGLDVNIVINIQGDEPLIQPKVIDDLARTMINDAQCPMATVIKVIADKAQINDPNIVKVVVDERGRALYFSRSAIPFNRDGASGITYFKHLGIYAYRKEFLGVYQSLPKSTLEVAEQLEQLRVLEAGYKIKTVVTDMETVGVDRPEDVSKVEAFLRKN